MAEFLGLVFSLVVLALVLLPILTFARLGRVSRELAELRARVDGLERSTSATAAATPDRPTETPVATATAPATRMEEPEKHYAPPVGPAALPVIPATPHAPAAPGAPAEPIAATEPAEDLEERIGGRGLLYTGVFVLLLGVSFFLKYAFDNAWINETARVSIGLVAGVSLILGGLRLATSGLATFGHALVGTGFAVLYLVVYAALNFYLLIDRGAAFAMMVLVTIAAAGVAHRRQSQPLAMIAVGGGLLTPALVGGDENAQLTLFTYDAILVVGTMLLSFRHQWPALNALSYAGTVLTVLGWSATYYTDPQWLRTLLFLTLFCVLFLIIMREMRRSAGSGTRFVRLVLGTAPILYHLAAIVITAQHPPAIHIYLIAFTAAGLWLTVDPHRPLLRLVLLLAVFVPMFGSVTLPDGRSWLVANVITIVAVGLLHVVALADRATRQDEALSGTELLMLHLTGLALFSLLYERLQPAFPEFRGALAVIIALAAVALGRALRPRDEIAWLNTLGLAFTLLAIGIAMQFDGPPVVIGWAAEGLAVAWLGIRARNRAFQFGGFVLWILATLQLFDSFSERPTSSTLIFNALTFTTIFVLVCGYLMAWRLALLGGRETLRMRTTLHVVASALTVAWITSEIQSYWDVRGDFGQAHLYEQMLLSLGWGLYGAILIAVGMARQFAPLRYIGIVIIAVTALKVFFYDLWELGGIYRVIGFLAFGVLLVLVSYLYQNRRRTAKAPPQAVVHDLPPI